MKKVNVILLISIFTILSFVVEAQKQPIINEMKLIAETPSEIRFHISAIAYNEGKIWAISSHDKGRYAIFNLEDNKWELSDSGEHYKAIREIAGRYNDVGGMTFANEKLWLGSGYGYSFGSVDMKTWKVANNFQRKHRDDNTASQRYAGMAFDGTYLWIAWHWYKYALTNAETQVLLKIEPETGKVIAEYPLPPGQRNAGARGLTYDGENLWDIKGNQLSKIHTSNGNVVSQYQLNEIKYGISLAWDGDSLWIMADKGLWKLPLKNN